MAKVQIEYVCQNCGAKSPKELGRCPVCGQWGTYIEEKTERQMIAQKAPKIISSGARPLKLHEVEPLRFV